MKEQVNHPDHYQGGGMEVIDVIEAFGLGFADGNVVKYVIRAPRKGTRLVDLRKARWYLDWEIERVEKEEASTEEASTEEATTRVVKEGEVFGEWEALKPNRVDASGVIWNFKCRLCGRIVEMFADTVERGRAHPCVCDGGDDEVAP